MFLFYRKGEPRGVVAPDGFVVKGVPKLPGGVQRRKYMLWLACGHARRKLRLQVTHTVTVLRASWSQSRAPAQTGS